jgi:ribosomal protein S18 acetylase RimI-like enzyme
LLLEHRRDAPIVADLADPAAEVALEVNRCAALADMATGPGGEFHDEPGLFWCLSGLPWDAFNAVGHCALADDEIDARIVEKQEYYRARGRPVVWWATPYTRPTNLVERLLAHGFTHRLSQPGMVVDLRELPDELAVPEGTTIARVEDVRTLEQWVRTCLAGFGVSEANVGPAIATFTRLALAEESEWYCFLTALDDKPVASAATLLTGGVAGIYWVGTVPSARRLGLGAAVTAAALRAARARGYRLGALTSSPLGYGVYRGLGFREYAQFHTYRWTGEPTR